MSFRIWSLSFPLFHEPRGAPVVGRSVWAEFFFMREIMPQNQCARMVNLEHYALTGLLLRWLLKHPNFTHWPCCECNGWLRQYLLLGSEFRARRYCYLLGHLEVEIVAKNRSTVFWLRAPFKRFPKGHHVKPRPTFNFGFNVLHMRSFPIIVSPSHRQTLQRTTPAVLALTFSGPVPPDVRTL
jgi:hypothetical protein